MCRRLSCRPAKTRNAQEGQARPYICFSVLKKPVKSNCGVSPGARENAKRLRATCYFSYARKNFNIYKIRNKRIQSNLGIFHKCDFNVYWF